MLKVTVASPSFLLPFGRLIVNVPVSVGSAPDSAASSSVAAMLTLAVAAKACGMIEFHPKVRTTSRSANWNARPAAKPPMRVEDFWKVDFIGNAMRRCGSADGWERASRPRKSSNSWYAGIKRALGFGQGLAKQKHNRNGEHGN